MINLKYIKNQKFNEIKVAEVLFYTFPLSFIIGNLAVNINTLLFIVTSLFLIQRKKLTLRFNNSYWLLITFFLYFILSTTIQFLIPGHLWGKMDGYWPLEYYPIIKSILLIRFIILIFVIDTLFINKILNLKKLFLSSMLCTSFVSFDIILQYITGFDIFGLKKFDQWNTGPFGDELIAGSYLQKFSFLSFFYIFGTLKNKNFNNVSLIFLIVLHLSATLLAGNRMPMILFLFGCLLIILLIRNLRFVMSLSLLIFLPILFILYKHDVYLNKTYSSFFNAININNLITNKKNVTTKQDVKKIESKNTQEEASLAQENKNIQIKTEEIIFLRGSGYNRIYRSATLMWKEQPWTGFGFKSFRVKCLDMLDKDNAERKITPRPQNIGCANHAHNYYFELLSEAGIVGTGLMVIFFLILLKDSFNYIKKYNQQKNSEMKLIIPFTILFFLEIWPLKSTGSFFTTWGATFFWLVVATLIAYKTKKSP